jgi:lysophospholipase L1-like esterase
MTTQKRTIVALGDSITLAAAQSPEKKWVNILDQKLNADSKVQWTLINAGVGGNTSREGLARIENDVLSHRPDVVFIEFGGNDATNDMNRHVSVDEFNQNLGKMLESLTKISARAVIVTFPPIIDEWHCIGKHEFYTQWGGLDRCVEEYRQASRQFAKKHGLQLADIDAAFRAAFKTQDVASFILPDGVHLTDKGNELVAQVVGKINV